MYCWVGRTSCKKAGQLASNRSQDETSQSLWMFAVQQRCWEKDSVVFHPLETTARMTFLVYSSGLFPASWLIVICNLLPELEVLDRGSENEKDMLILRTLTGKWRIYKFYMARCLLYTAEDALGRGDSKLCFR